MHHGGSANNPEGSGTAPPGARSSLASTMETAVDSIPQRLEVPLRVEAIVDLADGVRSFVLQHPDGSELPAWTPGAHVDLVFRSDLARPYSLCGDPERRDRWEVAILREPESRGGSVFAHDLLCAGDELSARTPRNHFPLVVADEYALIAGGIGITPLLPMIAEIERRGARWRLLYGGRRRASMAFVERLTDSHGDHITVVPEDEQGRPDLRKWLGAPRTGCAVYCCGPEGLIDAVEDVCTGWPEGTLHVERFRADPEALSGVASTFEVVAAQSGVTVTVGEDQSIVEALEDAGIYVPVSCGEGTCETCITQVLDGEPDHRDALLTDEQRSEGGILPCCSRSLSPVLVLDV
jgi:ferredoxin-NADP reductase